MNQNQDKQPTVFIVDDDPAIRFAMQALMDSVNIEHEIFASGDEFLENADDHRAGCLVLDIRMPGLGGLELQEELLKRGSTLPIIFITGHGDVPMAVDAMQKGAVDFIQKPFRDQDLLDRIREALKTDQERREEQQKHAEVAERLARLTNREREVFDLVVTGKPKGYRLRTRGESANSGNPPRQGYGEDAGEVVGRPRQDAYDGVVRRLHVRPAMLLEARAINTLSRVRMRFQAPIVDIGAALIASAVLVPVHAFQRLTDFRNLNARLIAKRIHNFAVFELFGPLFGIGVVATAQIRFHAVQTAPQFGLFGFQPFSLRRVPVVSHGEFSD